MKHALRKTDPMSFFDSFFRDYENGYSVATPSSDVYADEQSYHIDMDLPGFAKEEVAIEVKDNMLIIKAEHKEEDEKRETDGPQVEYYRKERSSAAYSRSFQMSEALDVDAISANFENGVLKLTIPKREKALPRQITIS